VQNPGLDNNFEDVPDKLRVVQVGCGKRGQIHTKAMLKSGVIELAALCDLDADRLQAAGQQFGVTRLYHDMAEMIRQEQPDLVDIITPPTLRAEIVEPALAAGAPALLIEKPIALRPAEAQKLVEWGRERLIAVNTQYQWMAHWQHFWPLLAARALGEIRLLRASSRCNILEQGPHILDLALQAARLSGLPDPEWVLAAASGLERFGPIPVPADLSATIGLGAARLHLNAGPSAPEVPGETVIWFQQQIEIIGDEGRLWVSLNQGWKLWRAGLFESGPTGWPADDETAQAAMFRQLHQAIRRGEQARFPTRVEVAARCADLMFGCYASALGRRVVTLPAEWPDSLVDELEQLGDLS
jgi:predicted dehydrogenase